MSWANFENALKGSEPVLKTNIKGVTFDVSAYLKIQCIKIIFIEGIYIRQSVIKEMK
jgi:hypothetical protein